MDIGPVRRRLTAEPVSSPVPGEESWIVENPVLDRTHPDDRTVPTPRPEPAR